MPVAPILPRLHQVPPLPTVKAAPEPEPPAAPMSAPILTLDAMADRLFGMRGQGSSGTRSLMVGETEVAPLAIEAASLGAALAAKGQTVILIDWAPAGGGIAEALGYVSEPGMLDLIAGRARFEDVVGAMGHSGAHLIPAGTGLVMGDTIDPNQINFALDALDGVYDQIIVVSREEAARRLFEEIEGRFDCGITIVSAEKRLPHLAEQPETFLGYEVEGMELMRYTAPAPTSFGKLPGRVPHLARSEPRKWAS
jgi:hypothetical protein